MRKPGQFTPFPSESRNTKLCSAQRSCAPFAMSEAVISVALRCGHDRWTPRNPAGVAKTMMLSSCTHARVGKLVVCGEIPSSSCHSGSVISQSTGRCAAWTGPRAASRHHPPWASGDPAGHFLQPAERECPVEADDEKPDLHHEGTIEKALVHGPQCICERDALLPANAVERVLQLGRLGEIELRRRQIPIDPAQRHRESGQEFELRLGQIVGGGRYAVLD